MRVFVAGATGVLGRRTVKGLLDAGHQVTGVARSPEKAAQLSEVGAHPVTVDLFDHDAVAKAIEGHDAVVNLTTAIPATSKATRDRAWRQNRRIRSQVSAVIVDAAVTSGVKRVIQESITFPYPDRGDQWIDESVPFTVSPHTDSVATAEEQVARFTACDGCVGIVLRFGLVNDADSGYTADAIGLARRGFAFLPGKPDSYVSQIAAQDAADAVVASLGAPPGAYNVVDDEPLTRAELMTVLAAAVGRDRLRPLPKVLVKVGGPYMEVLARSQRVSNDRLKATTGWRPSKPSSRESWSSFAPTPRGRASIKEARRGAARVVLSMLAAVGLVVGSWALFAPQSFYDDFPGAGRHWVSVDGRYNELHDLDRIDRLGNVAVLATAVALAIGGLVVSRPDTSET